MRRQQTRGHRDRVDHDPETLSGSSRQDPSPLPALSVEQSTSGGPTGHQDHPPFSRCEGSLSGDVARKGRVPRLIDSLPVQAHGGRVSCTYTYQQSHLPSVLYMHTSLIMLYSISASQPVLRQEGCPTISAIWIKPD